MDISPSQNNVRRRLFLIQRTSDDEDLRRV